MAQKILSVVLTFIPGVAHNQHRTGAVVFRFAPDKAQALVDAMEATIDAIIRAVNGDPEEEEPNDTQPAIPVPRHVPVPTGPAQRLPPGPKGNNMTVEEARRIAMELASQAVMPHNPIRQPSTIRRGSAEARAMQNARAPAETPIIQRRREAPGEPKPVDPQMTRRTKQPPILSVKDGMMVTGQRTTAMQTAEVSAEPDPIAIVGARPAVQNIVQPEVAPVVQEGFTPDDTDDYGPPPERIGEA
jgi:hypothetical protein